MTKYVFLLTLIISLLLTSTAKSADLPLFSAQSGKSGDNKSAMLHSFDNEWKRLQNATGPLSISGDVLTYWDGYTGTEIDGESREGKNQGAVKARLRLNWNPSVNGEFFLQMQGGYSDTGSNPSSRGLVASPLNSQASRTTAGGQISVSDVLYTRKFAKERAYVTFGWTDPESFIDENRFAGDGRIQFINTIFNNEPIFDSIDEALPIVAAGFQPVETLKLTVFTQASRRSALDSDQQKDAFEDMTDDPLIGGQVTFTTRAGEKEGNYRFFLWTETYSQPRIDNSGDSENWGIGFNMDQDITGNFGVFARIGRGNSAVNNITWTWSAGTHWQGPIHSRKDDVWGVAAGGVQGNRHTSNSDMEYHYETYYQASITENFSIVPDITYVNNPNCNSVNDDILFAMLKFFFTFSTP